jgi:hypothetical protein
MFPICFLVGYIGWFMNISQDVSYHRTHPQGFHNYSQVVIVVACGYILKSMALVFKANRLLVIVKDIKGLCPIGISETIFQLINYSVVLQFKTSFQKHLSLCLFGVSTFRGCETILFSIKAFFNLHPNWVMM